MSHPRGRVLREDEGSVAMAISVLPDKKTLIVDFGKPVKWFGLGKSEVLGLIDLLKKRSEEMVEASNVEYE